MNHKKNLKIPKNKKNIFERNIYIKYKNLNIVNNKKMCF